MNLPNFLIIGGQRCMSTWVWQVLMQHPQIAMAPTILPEPKFFVRDDEYAKGLEWYANYYWGQTSKPIRGEKSVTYLDSPLAAKRIACDLPGVKLVVILRDPVERAWSHYCYSVLNGYESLSFEKALEEENRRAIDYRGAMKVTRPYAYFERSLYINLLARYFEYFADDMIHYMFVENIKANPQRSMDLLYDFLDIDRQAINNPGIVNDTSPVERKLGLRMNKDIAIKLKARFASFDGMLARQLRMALPWGK